MKWIKWDFIGWKRKTDVHLDWSPLYSKYSEIFSFSFPLTGAAEQEFPPSSPLQRPWSWGMLGGASLELNPRPPHSATVPLHLVFSHHADKQTPISKLCPILSVPQLRRPFACYPNGLDEGSLLSNIRDNWSCGLALGIWKHRQTKNGTAWSRQSMCFVSQNSILCGCSFIYIENEFC